MERMKLTEKEKEQILKNGAEAMSKIIERMSIEMRELEEENKKLKEELFKIKRNTKYNWLQDTLVYDDSKTAIEQGARAYEAELHNRYVSELEEENRKLKEKVSELEDVSKDYDLLSKDFIALGEENKKLKEKVRFLEECLDRKEKEVNIDNFYNELLDD